MFSPFTSARKSNYIKRLIFLCLIYLLFVFPGGCHSNSGWSCGQIWPDHGICRDAPPCSVNDAAACIGHTGNQPGISTQTCECIEITHIVVTCVHIGHFISILQGLHSVGCFSFNFVSFELQSQLVIFFFRCWEIQLKCEVITPLP